MAIPSPPNRFEIWLGRSLALCVHPFTAWRLSSGATRALIVMGYAAAGYVAGFAVLLFIV
jgi:hypothetical protein